MIKSLQISIKSENKAGIADVFPTLSIKKKEKFLSQTFDKPNSWKQMDQNVFDWIIVTAKFYISHVIDNQQHNQHGQIWFFYT